MKYRAALAGTLLALSAVPMGAPALARPAVEAEEQDGERLSRIFMQDALREEALDPLSAIYRDRGAQPPVFVRLYTDALDKDRLASARRSLAALKSIRVDRLSEEERISYEVFLASKQEQTEWLSPDMLALTRVRPFNHFGGMPVEFPALMALDGAMVYRGSRDYRRALGLLSDFPTVLDNAIERFRKGMETGVVEPRITVEHMIAQIDGILAQPPEKSPFMSPVQNFPRAVPASDRPALRSLYLRTIRDRLNPAYARLRTFLKNEYLPAARTQPGLAAMKGGDALYTKLIARETTLPLDAESIHALGLSEVARIRGKMDEVQKQLGGAEDLPRFFEAIRTDQRFHPRSSAELAEGFARIASAVDANIPRYFAQVPRARLLIEPYPEYRARFEAGGGYSQGSPDGSRPGTFFYNTYDLPSRFLSGMTTLYLHEGAPGHHFQISLAQENDRLPPFQRFGGNNAFVEGWAHYAETLGYEMGFYKDPMQHWGTLDDEMLRAMRLVVDTGIHARGWSRDEAIAYMLRNSGMGRTDAETEVDRYIANPAQALSYKIGALTIQRLKAKAKAALGDRFDIRAFHEQVLGSGALTLPVLEAKIDRWIEQERQA